MTLSPKPLIGQALGHYRIVELIGAGGMGEIYRAHDDRLERDVALKVLAPGTLADDTVRTRFRKEALALSRLNHPNIATVFDFDTDKGIDFLVTELIPGTTLDERVASGPLAEKEILEIAQQLSEGLIAAHQQGIVHRDLKPSNIRLTPEGRLKILDFGLAKRIDRDDELSRTNSDLDAGPSGTLAYMAPEQLKAEKVDGRSDIWGAGTVLYEMATGRRPFFERTASALAGSILHTAPLSPRALRPELSARLERIITKCLEKDPSDRFQTPLELADNLRRLAHVPDGNTTATRILHGRVPRLKVLCITATVLLVAAGAAAVRHVYTVRTSIQSVAVMPFVNASGDVNSDYIGDAMAEELINELTRLPLLKVTARPTAFTYKGRQVSPEQVGKELGVGAVVFGRVTRSGDQLGVQVDIVNTADGSEIWGAQFHRSLSEMQSIQNEIGVQISTKLRLKLSGSEAMRLGGKTRNPDAYQSYLRGRFCLSQLIPDKLSQCVALFQQAVDLDPDYSQAWAGLADAYTYLGVLELKPPAEVANKARLAVAKALQLDETSPEAHTSLGIIKLCFEWDFLGAEAEIRRAMDLSPSDVFSRHFYAHYLEVTASMQRANTEMKKVVALDPLSNMYTADLALEYYFLHQPEKVVEMSKSWAGPNSAEPLAWIALALAYEQMGKNKEAEEIAQRLLANDDSAATLGYVGAILGRVGKREQARKILADLKRRSTAAYVPPFALAMVYFGMGDEAHAYEYLRQSYEQRSSSIVLILLVDPQFDRYRSEPQFMQLARDHGIPVKAGA